VNQLRSLTLPALLAESVRQFHDRPALSMVAGTPITYGELSRRVREAAALLRAREVRAGDRVAIFSENMPQWGIAYFAVTSLGAVAVPIMTEFPPAQVSHILRHSDCRALIVSAHLRAKMGAAPEGLAVIPVEGLAGGLDAPVPEAPRGAAPDAQAKLPEVAEDALAAIIYTSGTTGLSKGVMLTHRNIVFDAIATESIVNVQPTDRLLSILTLAHTYECTLGLAAALMRGASVFYLDKLPTASALIPAFRSVRPTIMLSVPLVIEKMFRARVLPELEKIPLYRLPGFRRIITLAAGRRLKATFGGEMRVFAIGGAALAPDVERFLRAARFPYAIGYGLTETAPVVAGAAPFKTRPRAAGPAMPGVQVRIADPRPGTGQGEIQVKGPNVMPGYYRDPERTREVFTDDGWFRTGDLGEIDRRGRVHIRGRLKTMILGASGENIYPEEIEAVINQSPFVDESLVYGDGTAVAALVQLKPDATEAFINAVQDAHDAGSHAEVSRAERPIGALLEHIRTEVNSKVAVFSQLHRIELQAEPFEKTPSQKIKRFLYPRRLGAPE
jgi:long-chain acyl-CoA synthetase